MESGKAHYRYRRSTQELAAEVSGNLMRRAREELAALEEVNRTGAYQPTWESLDGHACPEWFEDAKFGMFLDWGLYSVPGWSRPNPHGIRTPTGMSGTCTKKTKPAPTTREPGGRNSAATTSSRCSTPASMTPGPSPPPPRRPE